MSVQIHGSVGTSIDLHSQASSANTQAISLKRRYYSCVQCEYYNLDKEQLKSDICRCLNKGSRECDKCQIEHCQCLNELLYNLCEECMSYIHSVNIAPINEQEANFDIRDSLYYVLHDNDIGGPYTMQEIIKLYICRKFTDNRIQIMSAAKEECWCHIEFPNNIMPDIIHECIFCTLSKTGDDAKEPKYQKVLSANSDDNVHLYLYKRLVIDVLRGDLKQVIIPKKEPQYKHTLIWFLGIILVALLSMIIFAHSICTLIVAVCFAKIFALMRRCCDCVDNLFWNYNEAIHNMIMLLGYSGITICPILISYGILSAVDVFDNELQSWMIAYISWGIISFLTSLAYLLAEIQRSERRLYHFVSWFMFLVIGLDFGEIDIFDAMCSHVNVMKLLFQDSFKHKMVQVTILFLFPSLFSLLPSLVIGFAANYILDEKFLLDCSDDIEDTERNPCFGSDGCCELLSSHDYMNSYVFIGGVGSTCVTLWGFIRISAYLMASAFPSLSTYSRRIQ